MAYFYVKRFTVLGAKYFTHHTKYGAAPSSGPLCDGAARWGGQLTPARAAWPPLDRHMGLDHWTQDRHLPGLGACRISHVGQSGLREYDPDATDPDVRGVSVQSGFSRSRARGRGWKAGCLLGGWRRNSMRVYSQSSGEGTAELGFKAATAAGTLRTARCLGAAVQAPREEGKHFPDPTWRSRLERRRGLPRWPHGRGVSLSPRPLCPPLLPHHPVAEPTRKSEGSPRTVLQADSRGERDNGRRGVRETPTDVKGCSRHGNLHALWRVSR